MEKEVKYYRDLIRENNSINEARRITISDVINKINEIDKNLNTLKKIMKNDETIAPKMKNDVINLSNNTDTLLTYVLEISDRLIED